MHSRLVISSLILFLTDAAVSNLHVSGVVGQPATLPCTYAVSGGEVTSMCWGRGVCPVFKCSDEIVWTDGSRITFQKHNRYKLRGHILKGDVSLTIENATEADGGLYCCRVEHRGWFNDMKVVLSLEMKPATETGAPTSPNISTSASPAPSPMQTHTPAATSPSPAQPSETQPTTLQERRAQPTSSPFYSYATDGNGTVTQSADGLWHNNQTQLSPTQKPRTTTTTTNKGLYIGMSLFAVMLLALLVVIITKKCFYNKDKMAQLSMVSLNDSKIGALQNAAERRVPPEDNIYIIDDNVYVVD
ncbi:hepatitis A virus cellular receptor 1 [Otolemur garnettii]|uniref:hepatitis A virus cellular receptor 1 n=1 Tax=Otolemur garnettii TaxID=30611 RepID=UPI000273F7DD|nr:hepatitis A virus cellular receptor 1 [Otolemur garnettii]